MEASSSYPFGKPGFTPAKAGPSGAKPAEVTSLSEYTYERFTVECDRFLTEVRYCATLAEARERLSRLVLKLRIENSMSRQNRWGQQIDRTRDCARSVLCILSARSDNVTGFSVTQALWDISQGRPRLDLKPGFFAEIIHLIWGIEARTRDDSIVRSMLIDARLQGREAALARSKELDHLWSHVDHWMDRYPHGLLPESQERRKCRKEKISTILGASAADWDNWRWHVANVRKDRASLEGLIQLSSEELATIDETCSKRLPFGVTPYYLSLMDDTGGSRDRAVRRQVFPTQDYVNEISAQRAERGETSDFMQEQDTSPIDLVTRRYPGIAILKPYNTCPQICVYCQRNWEIDQVLAPDALAPWEKIEQAIDWIADHPAICEVLVTGGDPFLQEDDQIARLLDRLAEVPSVKRIRIGTRTPVTLPMRITDNLAEIIGQYRKTGRREVAVVTHVEHPYEITPETGTAVERLCLRGIPVYNQLVYTFFVSRRFEAALLRVLLRKVGIEPYYTFLPKGKRETAAYQVPLSRLLQEQTEEARLLPGLSRTDEAVYNVPRLGKNYLRGSKSRDLLTILPTGSRVYEFHPWEENIAAQSSYVGEIVPILDYLSKIEAEGGRAKDYESIWYYY
ncbi:MAG: KamA family radical SAM protein [Myxococcota bacterium]|nr:KamA family radical SAM protein [Myxococcota bacterium]